MSSKQSVIAEALRLSEAERLELAEALYEGLEVRPNRVPRRLGMKKLPAGSRRSTPDAFD